MAALCHDLGHLPLSHGPEELLPPGWKHERLSMEIGAVGQERRISKSPCTSSKELLGVPTGFEFVLYKHGPYSFDLSDVLSSMRSNGFLEWQPREPFGPSMIPSPTSERVRKLFPETPQKFKEQLIFVADNLAQKDVRDLDRIATALLVTREERSTVRDRAIRIHELKPHVSIPDAISAVEKVDRIRNEANSIRIVTPQKHSAELFLPAAISSWRVCGREYVSDERQYPCGMTVVDLPNEGRRRAFEPSSRIVR